MLRLLRNETILVTMALEFARSSVLSRSAGHSAVKAAAYRSGERLVDERIGQVADYSHRAGEVGHSEILLPTDADDTFLDRTTLWHAVEAREDQHNRRASAQLAIDHVIALPRELSKEQHIELAKAFAEKEFVSRGLVVDLAIHYHSKDNPHAHLLTTTRALEGREFGGKERGLSGKFYGGQKIPEVEQLRHRWAAFQNGYFREKEIDAVVHSNNGEYRAEVHLGPAHAMESQGKETVRQQDNLEAIKGRERAILDEPEIIISRVSDRRSLFTRHALYRELSSLVNDPAIFQSVKAALDVHPSLISFQTDGKEYLTTQAVLETEQLIRGQGELLGREESRFGLVKKELEATLDRYDFLSDEQREAAVHITQANRLGIVVGLAGAGKSTLLRAVREAYESAGHRVTGIALAGKAAEELEASAGIESRTIASWLFAVKQGREEINPGDVITLDEAGMVNNATMLEVLETVERGGAKLILVGDGEQLQAIQAGCPFRDLSVQHGFAEIETIRRQKNAWQRQATLDLARGRAKEAVAAYREAGRIHKFGSAAGAQDRLVSDYLADQSASRIVLAHRRVDVASINQAIRESLVEGGHVAAGKPYRSGEVVEDEPFDFRAGDTVRFSKADTDLSVKKNDNATYLGFEDERHRVRSDDGREIRVSRADYSYLRHTEEALDDTLIAGVGDRVLFTRNDSVLGVKNGTLGTVESFRRDELTIQLDDGDKLITVKHEDYPHVALGYATTIHKAQGMTVDRSFVLGSATMDKHLGYVALSRHRENVDVYLSAAAMHGKTFESVIGESNRQETVLDFAERHGLELDAASPETLRFTAITQTQEGRMVSGRSVAGRGSLLSSGSETMTLDNAQRVLKRETDANLLELDRAQQVTVDEKQQDLEIANQVLVRHQEARPREGLFSNKAKLESWREKRRSLEIDRGNKLRSVKREEEAYRGREGLRRPEAEGVAKQNQPVATRIVETAEAATLAQSLSNRWSKIERDLAIAQATKGNESTIKNLRAELDLVFKQIEQSASVKAAMPTKRMTDFTHTKEGNAKAIEQARGRQRGRGLSR